MTIFLLAIVIVLIFLKYLIFLDIILSWLTIFGIKFRPYILSSVIDPIYDFIKSKISTTLGPIDFTPIIIFIFIEIIIVLIYGIDINVKYKIEAMGNILNLI